MFKKKNSMQFKLMMALVLILVPILLMILIGSISSIRVVQRQVESVNQNIVNHYMTQIDDSLVSAYNTIGILAVTDTDLSTIVTTESDSIRYFAKYRLLTRLEDELSVYNNIFGFFVYSYDGTINLERYQDSASYIEKKDIRKFVAELAENRSTSTGTVTNQGITGLAGNDNATESVQTLEGFSLGWKIAHIKDNYYLIRLFPYQNHIVGSCISIANLVDPLSELELGENGFILVTDQNNQPIYNSQRVYDEGIALRSDEGSYWVNGNQGRYLAVDSKSMTNSFNLLVLFPEKELMKGFSILIQVLIGICILCLFLVPLGLFRINRLFLKPLRDLTDGMKEIGSGNLNFQLDLKPHYDELDLVNTTFNAMTDEINQLKIDVYEEQIDKQKAELQYLQLQIRPHFLLNSLNVVYSLAQLKKFDLIKEMTMCLVSHFRYILRDGLVCVRFSEELEHIRNYLRIQELRMPGTLRVNMKIEEGLGDVLIPPLLIHTLLENTFKHAIVIGETILVTLEINRQVSVHGEIIHILLKDTGKGFSEEALKKLNQKEENVDYNVKNIGIQNIRHRIRYIYGDVGVLSFYNNSAGEACNEITLPIQYHFINQKIDVE